MTTISGKGPGDLPAPLERLHPQMREAVAMNASLQPDNAAVQTLPISEMRAIFDKTREFWNGNPIPVHRVEDHELLTRKGTIGCRSFYPSAETGLPIIIYLHGGGWVLGSGTSHDSLARALCRHTESQVISLDYALAPENAYPVAIDEVCAAVEHLAAGFETDDPPRKIFLCGDSAGGNLAIEASLKLAARNEQILTGVISIYGVLNRTLNMPSVAQYGDGRFGLSRDRMAFFWDQYAPEQSVESAKTDLCRADLSGLPPAYIIAAECDPLRDSSLLFAGQLARQGGRFSARVALGMAHAYMGYGRYVDEARATAVGIGQFMRDVSQW